MHHRLVSQLETAHNVSVAAKNAFLKDSSTPDDTDALMRLSRQATTAAVATEQYHEKLKRSAEQLRKELSSMEERGGSKSSSPSPAPVTAVDDPELMALKLKSDAAMEKFTEMVERPGDASAEEEETTKTTPGPKDSSN